MVFYHYVLIIYIHMISLFIYYNVKAYVKEVAESEHFGKNLMEILNSI